MNIAQKKDLDEIVKIAPTMAALTGPACTMAAAFCAAQDMVNQGDNEGALYLLKNHPRVDQLMGVPSGEEMGNSFKSLFDGE